MFFLKKMYVEIKFENFKKMNKIRFNKLFDFIVFANCKLCTKHIS